MPFTEWIEANAVTELIRASRWGYPATLVAHLMGMAALVGAAALFDLRLLGFWRSLSVAEAARHLMPVVWIGFGVALISGGLLFSTDAGGLLENPAFRLKVALIGVAGLNAASFHAGVLRNAKAWDREKTPPAAKAAACVSLIAWAGVVACGRLIAYV